MKNHEIFKGQEIPNEALIKSNLRLCHVNSMLYTLQQAPSIYMTCIDQPRLKRDQTLLDLNRHLGGFWFCMQLTGHTVI